MAVLSVVPVKLPGSTGTSHSVNLPALNTLGTELKSIPANPKRNWLFIENQSANDLTIVGDDGAGANVWYLKCSSSGTANAQGDRWETFVFLGRIRIYGAAGSQVSAAEF